MSVQDGKHLCLGYILLHTLGDNLPKLCLFTLDLILILSIVVDLHFRVISIYLAKISTFVLFNIFSCRVNFSSTFHTN